MTAGGILFPCGDLPAGTQLCSASVRFLQPGRFVRDSGREQIPRLMSQDFYRSNRAMDSLWAVWGNMSITPAWVILYP